MGVLHSSSVVAGTAVEFNSGVSAMPADSTRTFATPPHPGTADTLLQVRQWRISQHSSTNKQRQSV